MTLQVTCAIIQHDDKVLVVKRSASMSLPLKWEFPGGKLESGESEEDCIIREIKEELCLDIELVGRLNASFYEYPTLSIELIPFIANQAGGQIRLNEHAEYKYLPKNELIHLDWAEADLPILKSYLNS